MNQYILKILGVFLSLGFLLILPRSSKSYAQFAPPVSNSITVSTSVGDTALVFEGLTSPYALVVFMKDGSVIGSTEANGSGHFYKRLTAMPRGLNKISIYTTDTNDSDSSTVTFSIALTPHTDTTVSNIILPPTLEIERHQIKTDENVRVRGKGAPNALLTLFFFKDRQIKTVETDSEGNWSIRLSGEELLPKKYQLYAKIFTFDGRRSSESDDQWLEVLATDTQLTEDTDINAQAPSLTAQLLCELPRFFSPFDFDSSCTITHQEFLVAVREWYDGWRANRDCDIDGDNDCDLADFSVLMYYINR